MSGRTVRWLMSLVHRPRWAGPRLVVIRHHRVYAAGERPLYRLGVREDVLAGQLAMLGRLGLAPVTLSEGLARLGSGEQRRTRRGSDNAQQLRGALNPSQLRAAKQRAPGGKEHDRDDPSRDTHGRGVSDDLRLTRDARKESQRRRQEEQGDRQQFRETLARGERPGDEINSMETELRMKSDPQWIYRPDPPKKTKAAEAK